MQAFKNRGGKGLGILLALAVAVAAAGLLWRPAQSVSAARTFYVSRGGNNADGLSWATAWNELSRINWGVVQAGDTVLLDGGAVACPALGPGYNCGMVYNSTLSITKSGTSGAPITVRLAGEAGRNGTVVIDGGLTQWSRCSEYAAEPTPPASPNGAGLRDTGIRLNTSAWIVLDGVKWGGIEVRNHTRYGLNLGGSQHVLARYLKLHHNTDPTNTTNGAVGITQNWQSAYNTVARVEVFRNGQDAVRGAGDYFTLEESYLHNHYCNHPDGLQSFVPTSNGDVPDNAGEVRGLVVRRNVFDRIGLQTLFLGENASHNSWNVDVTIHDNLLLNNAYVIKSKHGASRNWNIYRNTIFNASAFAVEWCCASPGAQAPMTLRDNIFVNVKPGQPAFYLPTGGGTTTFAGNCLFNTGTLSGQVSESGTLRADPLFTNSSLGNFALAPSSGCAGKGSSLTSLNQLLSLTGGSAPLPPTQPPPPTATNQPVQPTATGQPVQPTATGQPAQPTATNQPPATATPAVSGSATLTFAPAADAYVDASHPNNNFGNSTIIRNVTSPEQRTYLRFNVNGVAGRPVVRALLRVYANRSSQVGFAVQRVSDNNWLETGLTYNNKPGLNGVVANSGTHGGASWVTVDVTSLIAGDGIFSLAMTTTSPKAVSYPSDEAGSNRPELIVEVGGSAAGVTQPTATSIPPTATPAATSVPPSDTVAAPTGPATLAIAPAADAYVDAGSPTANFGSSIIVRTFASPEQRSYLRFNVAGVGGRPVTKALLRIYANGSSPVGFVVHGVPNSMWDERLINYDNRPRTDGEIAASGSHNHAVWVTVDVTDYITGDGIYTLALLTASTKAVGYPSREGAANQPQLVLTLGN